MGCIITMAERYQERPFSAADYDRGDPHGAGRGESDPLAELARLIGQNDPLAAAAKPAPRPLQSRANIRPQYTPPEQQYDLPEEADNAPPSPPTWMQRARQEAAPPPPPQDYDDEPEYQPAPVHPLHRYAAQPPQAPAQDFYEQPQYADAEPQPDPSRYDDALYGRIESEQDYQRDPAFPDDPYAYQNGYEEEPAPKKRSSGLITVAAVLTLAVVGTGAAFAYRTYVGSPRSGEPPIIRADNSPTKLVPAQSDGGAKTPDRMPPGDGGEKLVSREEAPVDVNSRSGAPRVVFPPLNQNSNPPQVASVSPTGAALATAANGTMPNNEPRRIKTLAVKGDAAENGGIPAGAAAPPPRPGPTTRSVAAPAAAPAAPAAPSAPAASPGARNPASANASANTPMLLAPQSGQPSDSAPTRVAATNPTQTVPATNGSGYLVQVSSQKNEADAQASFRALQGKFPNVLGSRSPVIKRADLGEKGVYYRAMVGPFGSPDEASQFCGSLKTAGGQCVVQRN
jgi:SPOR domain